MLARLPRAVLARPGDDYRLLELVVVVVVAHVAVAHVAVPHVAVPHVAVPHVAALVVAAVVLCGVMRNIMALIVAHVNMNGRCYR